MRLFAINVGCVKSINRQQSDRCFSFLFTTVEIFMSEAPTSLACMGNFVLHSSHYTKLPIVRRHHQVLYSSLSTQEPLPLLPFSNLAIVFSISLNSAVRCSVPQYLLK